ncbi:MAG: molybdopterin-dependent oxidoreductase [Candidatus Promineifilaceae bacterium]
MRQPAILYGALLGGLTSLGLMGLQYLAMALLGLPFAPFRLFDWFGRVLPGDLVTLGIDSIVNLIISLNLGETSSTAKAIEQLMALALFVLGAAALGGLAAGLIRRLGWSGAGAGSAVGGLALMALVLVEAGLASGEFTLATAVGYGVTLGGWGAILGRLLASRPEGATEAADGVGRRALLGQVAAGSALLALGSLGLGRLLGAGREAEGSGVALAEFMPTRAAATPDAAATAAFANRIEPAPGTRPEVTSNEDFYRIDINTMPPIVEKESWLLQVEGLFDRPRPLSLDDLMAYPAVTMPITLSCISNRVGGDLIGASYWTGVRLSEVLSDLRMRSDARELFIESADGFFESVAMEDMQDPRTILVYGMNGETLPVEHGFPLRIYIPNRYGMKQPKWIVKMTAIAEEGQGYWVVRGWSEEAIPQIVSVIDNVATGEPTAEGLIPVGGIAWAGDRGIQRVELQVDEGQWVEATLRTPTLSELTWVQWRYDWPAASGSHILRVRATDGDGTLQTSEVQGVRPDGATGYHSIRVRV